MSSEHYDGPERRESFGFRLSREISIADIVAVVMIGLPALVWASKMDTRMGTVEAMVVTNRAERIAGDARIDAERESLRREIKGDLAEINRKLDRLVERR